jgi:membrane associated rhomboid family serine protease
MNVTLVIIILTTVVSINGFNNRETFLKLQFNPYQVHHRKQWYRLLSHSMLHADYAHLFINMFVLYSFGTALEYYFAYFFGTKGMYIYILLYISSIAFASIGGLIKHKDNHYYNAVGASGAVSAVVFAAIFFAPLNKILFFMVLPIPGIIFGVLYLVYSYYMSKKANDHVAHDAHFFGAVYGFFFPLIIDYKLIFFFFDQLKLPF